MKKIPPRKPEQAPEWDPNTSRYWDPRDLEQELLRQFHICADCRMCVTYCGSFPILFERIDDDIESGRAESVELVGPDTIDEVADHCWQCKLCYVKCPYTEDEDSYELMDFPSAMQRVVALRAKRDGVKVVDKVLGEPALIGKLGAGPPAPLANLVNSTRLVRKIAEKTTGISSNFLLPPMASEPFPRWFQEHEPLATAGDEGRVVLFSTCNGDYNFPEVPRAAVRVLEKNGYEVVHVPEIECCGMPNLDGGDVDAATKKMKKNVDLLIGHVRSGLPVLVVGPTCGYTIKSEWPRYVGTAEAKAVAKAAQDSMEFLDGLRRDKKLNKDFEKGFGRVAYHAACHLRAQKIAYPAARVLMRLPDTEVRIIERCSAVDGTWGMKAKFYDEGRRYGRKLARAIEDGGEEIVIGDCSLAGQRVLQETGMRLLHPMQAVAEAYGLNVE